jgi:hypothetical protein
MALVASQKVVCTSGVSTFKEDVVSGARGDVGYARWHDDVSMVLDQLQQLLA